MPNTVALLLIAGIWGSFTFRVVKYFNQNNEGLNSFIKDPVEDQMRILGIGSALACGAFLLGAFGLVKIDLF